MFSAAWTTCEFCSLCLREGGEKISDMSDTKRESMADRSEDERGLKEGKKPILGTGINSDGRNAARISRQITI